MRCAVIASALILGLGFASQGAVYQQGPSINASNANFSAATSNQKYFVRTYDDFVSDGQTLTGLAWWGASSGSVADLQNFSGFHVGIYGEILGRPDVASVKYQATVSLASLQIVETGRITVSGNKEYRFEMALPSLNLAAGKYWLSVASMLNTPGSDCFAWNTSEQGNNANVIFLHGTHTWLQRDGDQAFVLIPGSSTAALGLIAVAAVRRRRARLDARRVSGVAASALVR